MPTSNLLGESNVYGSSVGVFSLRRNPPFQMLSFIKNSCILIFVKKKTVLLSSIPALLCAVFTVLSIGAMSQTADYKMDEFSSDLYDKKQLQLDSYAPPILQIKKQTQPGEDSGNPSYYDLFHAFYYNSLVYGVRYCFDNSIRDDENRPIQCFTQSTFDIDNSFLPEGGHYVDYGIFSSYFGDEFLGYKGHLATRFGADSFAYISDTYADKLLSKYGIESYEELITNEKYCLLDLTVDNAITSKLCINNILYSDKRGGPRARDLYGDFALVFNSAAVGEWASFDFEIDLKANSYSIQTVLSDVEALGYNPENASFSFLIYDEFAGQYSPRPALAERYRTLRESRGVVFLVLFWISVVLALGGCSLFYLMVHDRTIRAISLVSVIALFVIYGLVCNFVYSYYLFSIIPLGFLLLSFCFCWKEVKRACDYVFNATNKKQGFGFASIEI